MIAFYAFAAIATLCGLGLVLRSAMTDETPDYGDGTSVPDSSGDSTPSDGGAGANPATTDRGDVVGLVTENLKDLERFASSKYEDPPGSGKWSIGYGHQIKLGESFPQYISEDTAVGLLATDVSLAWGCVMSKVKVAVNTNQAAALVSFCYNVGCSAFGSSTMLRKLNTGDYKGAADEFDVWIYANHVINAGLVSRRREEKALFEA